MVLNVKVGSVVFLFFDLKECWLENIICCFVGFRRVDGRDFIECEDRGFFCFWGVCGDCI